MMTPSRIRSAAGAADYYAKDDYYIEGEAGAPNLEWGGQGAADLGLKGKVDAKDLRAILDGRNPDPNGPALTDSENKAKHHAGWDFTFAVPKSVTLLVIAAEKHDPELADRLKGHVMAANKAMMSYLEANHAVTRVRDEQGAVREVQTKNLVYGSVMHVTTRGGDPHLHVHNPIANVTKNPETGKFGALETRHMYKWQKNTSLVGARELQSRLMAEGYSIERKGELAWEIAGTSTKLIQEFSSRSREINAGAEALAAERGVLSVSDEQRTMIQKQTRKTKGDVVREVLQKEWSERAEKVDPGALAQQVAARTLERGQDVTAKLIGAINPAIAKLRKMVRDHNGSNARIDLYARATNDPDKEAQAVVSLGLRSAEERDAVVSKHLILQKALLASDAGVTYDRLEASFDRFAKAGHIVEADRTRMAGVTTARTLVRETAIVGAIERGRGAAPELISAAALDKAMRPEAVKDRTGLSLTKGQAAGARHMLQSRDRYAVVEGLAGVGKTTALRVTNDVAERHGLHIFGIASQHRFAEEIRKAGVGAATVESFLRKAERAMEVGGQRLERLRANFAKTILMVDESSTLTNETMYRLVNVVDGLRIPAVRFQGDRGQLGGPGAGNPFKAIIDRKADRVMMDEILRQSQAPTHLRDAVQRMGEGKFKEGLTLLRPNIESVGRDADQAAIADRVVSAYLEMQAQRDTQIVVATNAMRGLVSARLRNQLQDSGALSRSEREVDRLYAKNLSRAEQVDARFYALGDKIVSNDAFAGAATPRHMVETIVGVDRDNNMLKVRSDKGRERMVDLNDEAARRSPSFSTFTERAHPIAAGDRMVWEARFSDRGYERGGAFSIVAMDSKAVTIRHEGQGAMAGKVEKLSATDEALRFSGYGYAMTADRAQGSTFKGVVFEMSSKLGEAANMARLYVMSSRLAEDAKMITDDLSRTAQLILRQDGQKLVALDEIRRAEAELRKDDAKTGATASEKDKEFSKSMDKGMSSSGGAGAERPKTRTKERDTQIQQQQNLGL